MTENLQQGREDKPTTLINNCIGEYLNNTDGNPSAWWAIIRILDEVEGGWEVEDNIQVERFLTAFVDITMEYDSLLGFKKTTLKQFEPTPENISKLSTGDINLANDWAKKFPDPTCSENV